MRPESAGGSGVVEVGEGVLLVCAALQLASLVGARPGRPVLALFCLSLPPCLQWRQIVGILFCKGVFFYKSDEVFVLTRLISLPRPSGCRLRG